MFDRLFGGAAYREDRKLAMELCQELNFYYAMQCFPEFVERVIQGHPSLKRFEQDPRGQLRWTLSNALADFDFSLQVVDGIPVIAATGTKHLEGFLATMSFGDGHIIVALADDSAAGRPGRFERTMLKQRGVTRVS